MNDLRTVAQQALEAWDSPTGMKDLCEAMDAIRAALAQPAPEPVARFDKRLGHPALLPGAPLLKADQLLYTAPPEPVAQCSYPNCQTTAGCSGVCKHTTAPPQRKPLAVDEMRTLADAMPKARDA